MAHEITATDNLVLHRERAWHDLGIIVENAPTPEEAARIAKLDWTVEQYPLVARKAGVGFSVDEIAIENQVANIRSDTRKVLGIVGDGWRPYQNLELAKFCSELAEAGDTVKVESAGSIRGGEKVWFLLKGESFSVRGNGKDMMHPYILAANGFDGNTALTFTPTSVRVVCSNTLHMVIPEKADGSRRKRAGANSSGGYTVVHTKSLDNRIEECKQVLGLYNRQLATQREAIDSLAARDVNDEKVRRFLLECCARDFGPITDNPTTESEAKHREKAIEANNAGLAVFLREQPTCGANAWTMFNAYSGWLQGKESNRKGPEKAADAKLGSLLFGLDAKRTVAAFAAALAV